jgi:arylsulfatase A-like enzyme
MGISHSGQIQKNFNMYEQATRVPLIYSNPELYPDPLETTALVSHVDLVPTMAALLGTPKSSRAKWEGVDYSAVVLDPQKAEPPQDYVVFTFDDFQGGQAQVGTQSPPVPPQATATPTRPAQKRLRCNSRAHHPNPALL